MVLKKIGILDFGYRLSGNDLRSENHLLIKEAVYLDKLGFSRIWYSEHLKAANTLWSSPDLLLPIIASYTTNINIGVAGTSIRYNNPYKIAEDYTLLSVLFPGRIDLGFSKGRSTFYEQLLKVNDISIENWPSPAVLDKRIKLIISIIHSKKIYDMPNLWYLTGSPHGYLAALNFEINCCRTLMHSQIDLDETQILHSDYKNNFFQKANRFPESTICVAGTIQNDRKLITQIKKSQEALINVDQSICGPAKYVYEKLLEYAVKYQTEEIIFYELGTNYFDRNRSFKYLGKILAILNKL